jgi:hypothetical protein
MTARNKTGKGGFKKGQSGNPSGRPAVDKEIKTLALQHGQDSFRRIVELTQDSDSRIALAACREVLDRAYGKPSQEVEHSGGISFIEVNISEKE